MNEANKNMDINKGESKSMEGMDYSKTDKDSMKRQRYGFIPFQKDKPLNMYSYSSS